MEQPHAWHKDGTGTTKLAPMAPLGFSSLRDQVFKDCFFQRTEVENSAKFHSSATFRMGTIPTSSWEGFCHPKRPKHTCQDHPSKPPFRHP